MSSNVPCAPSKSTFLLRVHRVGDELRRVGQHGRETGGQRANPLHHLVEAGDLPPQGFDRGAPPFDGDRHELLRPGEITECAEHDPAASDLSS